jgi:hypothetical protein
MSIKNAADLKVVDKTASVDNTVRLINNELKLADEHETKATWHRLNAGRMLVDLRRRVEARGEDWWPWAQARFTRSRGDLEKLLAIGRADNPEAAAKEAQARNRAHQAAHRAKVAARTAAYVSGTTEPQPATADGFNEGLRMCVENLADNPGKHCVLTVRVLVKNSMCAIPEQDRPAFIAEVRAEIDHIEAIFAKRDDETIVLPEMRLLQ